MPDLHLRLDGVDTDTPPPPLEPAAAIALLECAEMSGEALVPWGSNYTFAVALQTEPDGRIEQFGIYKPKRGERPLWDFPRDTLYLRERASWLLAAALGWAVVPPTVLRSGPYGVGSLQLYLAPDEELDEDSALDFWGDATPEIERIALFDLIANNADRKLTHLLRDRHGRICGIDHGLTFNVAPKLRTVLWQFAGYPISPPLLADITRVREEEATLRAMFGGLLLREEVAATLARMDALLASGRHPELDPHVNIPYGWW